MLYVKNKKAISIEKKFNLKSTVSKLLVNTEALKVTHAGIIDRKF